MPVALSCILCIGLTHLKHGTVSLHDDTVSEGEHGTTRLESVTTAVSSDQCLLTQPSRTAPLKHNQERSRSAPLERRCCHCVQTWLGWAAGTRVSW